MLRLAWRVDGKSPGDAVNERHSKLNKTRCVSLFWDWDWGELWVLKINSISPVHFKEPAAGADKFEQLTEGLSSSWWLWLHSPNLMLSLSPILLPLTSPGLRDRHEGSLIWKLINFSLCHVSSLLGERGLFSLEMYYFSVVSAQGESQGRIFLRFNSEHPSTTRNSREWSRSHSLAPSFLMDGSQAEWVVGLNTASWKSGGMSLGYNTIQTMYLIWTRLFFCLSF